MQNMKTTSTTKKNNNKFNLIRYTKDGFGDYLYHIKLFSKNVRMYLFGSFLMGINFQIFQLLFNLYLKDLGFNESNIGLIISFRAVGMTIIAIPAAILLSRIKLKPILLASCFLFGLFTFFLTSYIQMELLIGFSILNGMAFAFYRVAAGPFYMRNSTEVERTYIFSISFGMMILAGMAGSIASGKMVTVIADITGDIILGYKYTLFTGIFASLLALIPFYKIKASAPSSEENRININKEQLKQRGKFYFKVTISNFLVGLGAGLIIPFLNLYFRDRFNLKPDTIGFFYFLVALSMLIGSLSGPVLAKRFGLVRAVVITQLISIPFMFILSYSYFLPIVVVAFVLRAGFMNLGVPIVTNLGMELSSKEEQGLVNALLMISWTSSWMISAAVGGSLIEAYGYTVTINITIVLYVLSTILFYSFFKKVEVKSEATPRWVIIREVNS